jgi:transcriptional regulator with XRE-family HTH domain
MDGSNEPMMLSRRRRTYSESLDVALGQRIRRLRILRNMSQNDLARHLSMTFQQIQKYEMGRNRISVGSMVMIAQALGTSVALLMHGLESHLDRGVREEEASLSSRDLMQEAQQLAEGLEMMGLFNAIVSTEARATLRSLATMLQALPYEGHRDAVIQQRCSRARFEAGDSQPAYAMAE